MSEIRYRNVKQFVTEEDAREYAKTMEKCKVEIALVNDKTVILCRTCQSYEEFFSFTDLLFDKYKLGETDKVDALEVVDVFQYTFERLTGMKFITGHDDYRWL